VTNKLKRTEKYVLFGLSHSHLPGGKKSKKQAIESGDSLFWSEKKCKRGHSGLRYTLNSNCRQCQNNRNLEIKLSSNPEKENNDRAADKRKKAEILKEKIQLEKELNDFDF